MKGFVRWMSVVAAAAVLAVSCGKDEDSGSLSFEKPAVFLASGQTVTVGFSGTNIRSYSVTGKPTGWSDPVIDAAAGTLTVTAPAEITDEVVKSGTFILSGVPYDGAVVSASLFAAVSDPVDMSDRPANSYLVNKPETSYLIDAMHKGNGDLSLATASVDVIWQTSTSLIQYLTLEGDKVSFYIGADDSGAKVKEGNALIGAYDADGTLIWSWHIWATDYDPETDGSVDLNGYTMMARNLGALDNSNESPAKILASYGLYYQWGRKDPFIGPATYRANNGTSGSMYNGSGSRVYLKTTEASAETGNETYAVQHPLTYITGVEESGYDWLWTAHLDALWGPDNDIRTKTVSDPCPYGWRVAPAAAFEGLSIVGTPVAEDVDKFGWTLTDGSAQSLFIGAGRRRYDNSTILNVYNPPVPVRSALEAQPWEGLYWTSATQTGTVSSAFHFWFQKMDTSAGLENNVPYARANGMSVRCVKIKSV